MKLKSINNLIVKVYIYIYIYIYIYTMYNIYIYIYILWLIYSMRNPKEQNVKWYRLWLMLCLLIICKRRENEVKWEKFQAWARKMASMLTAYLAH
jgi:hypothetical protein